MLFYFVLINDTINSSETFADWFLYISWFLQSMDAFTEFYQKCPLASRKIIHISITGIYSISNMRSLLPTWSVPLVCYPSPWHSTPRTMDLGHSWVWRIAPQTDTCCPTDWHVLPHRLTRVAPQTDTCCPTDWHVVAPQTDTCCPTDWHARSQKEVVQSGRLTRRANCIPYAHHSVKCVRHTEWFVRV